MLPLNRNVEKYIRKQIAERPPKLVKRLGLESLVYLIVYDGQHVYVSPAARHSLTGELNICVVSKKGCNLPETKPFLLLIPSMWNVSQLRKASEDSRCDYCSSARAFDGRPHDPVGGNVYMHEHAALSLVPTQ